MTFDEFPGGCNATDGTRALWVETPSGPPSGWRLHTAGRPDPAAATYGTGLARSPSSSGRARAAPRLPHERVCLTCRMTNSGDAARPDGHTWTVESIAGVPTTEPRPQLSLGEDGSLTGTTGVNLIRGTYEAHDETINIGDAGMTRMAGPPEAMDQERRFLQALKGWNSFHVADGRLEIGPPDAGVVCVLNATAPPEGEGGA